MPTYLTADVVVCGGGTAGAFAAIAAAKEGADVLLVESLGGLGGSAVGGLVLPMMPLHIKGEPKASFVHHELEKRMQEYGASDNDGASFDPLILGAVLEQMCVDSGVKLLFHSNVCGAETEDGQIKHVFVACKDGIRKIEGKIFIDCTGDASLGVVAGAGFEAGEETTGRNQAMSLRYIVGGVDKKKLGDFFDSFGDPNTARGAHRGHDIYSAVCEKGNWILKPLFLEAIKNGDLVEADQVYWQVFGVPGRDDTLAFNNPEFFDHPDATEPMALSAIQVDGKKAILRQLQFYRKYFPGCEKAYVSCIAPMVGVRESRRLHTKYILTAKDLLGHKKFDSRISQGNYPVDIHGRTLQFAEEMPNGDPKKPWYEIPFESLVSSDFDNLMVAGRCAGADFIAQSAIRVQPHCRSMGEATGVAAAMCLMNNQLPSEVCGVAVAKRMAELGAEFV